MQRALCGAAVLAGLAWAGIADAATYKIDPEHAFIQWKVRHLGFSWLVGRFNRFEGTFEFDPEADAAAQKVSVVIDTESLDSNHATRDKHLRSAQFLNASEFPTATFESTSFEGNEEGGTLKGNLTLRGVTKEIEMGVSKIGEGEDPWGGYRAGFEGTTQFDRREFGMDTNIGPTSWLIELDLYVEGVRQ